MFLLEVFLATSASASASLYQPSNQHNVWENFIEGRDSVFAPRNPTEGARLASHAARDAEDLIEFLRKLENGETYLSGVRGSVFQARGSTSKTVMLESVGERPLIVVLSRADGGEFSPPEQDRLHVLIDKYFLA